MLLLLTIRSVSFVFAERSIEERLLLSMLSDVSSVFALRSSTEIPLRPRSRLTSLGLLLTSTS